MRESEGKWKEAGAAEILVPKIFINDQDQDPSLQCSMKII